jgi:hypothetical protein
MKRAIVAVHLPPSCEAVSETRLADLLLAIGSLEDAMTCVDDGVAPPPQWMARLAYGIGSRVKCCACGNDVPASEMRRLEAAAAARGLVQTLECLTAAIGAADAATAEMGAISADANVPRILAAARAADAAIDALLSAFITVVNSPDTPAPVWTGAAAEPVEASQRELCPLCGRAGPW